MNAIIPAQRGEHWEVIDVGLELNREEGGSFWRRGEIVNGYATINGLDVMVTVHSGRMGGRQSLYAVSVNGKEFPFLCREQAIAILDNIRTPIGDYIDAEYGD